MDFNEPQGAHLIGKVSVWNIPILYFLGLAIKTRGCFFLCYFLRDLDLAKLNGEFHIQSRNSDEKGVCVSRFLKSCSTAVLPSYPHRLYPRWSDSESSCTILSSPKACQMLYYSFISHGVYNSTNLSVTVRPAQMLLKVSWGLFWVEESRAQEVQGWRGTSSKHQFLADETGMFI